MIVTRQVNQVIKQLNSIDEPIFPYLSLKSPIQYTKRSEFGNFCGPLRVVAGQWPVIKPYMIVNIWLTIVYGTIIGSLSADYSFERFSKSTNIRAWKADGWPPTEINLQPLFSGLIGFLLILYMPTMLQYQSRRKCRRVFGQVDQWIEESIAASLTMKLEDRLPLLDKYARVSW